MPHYTLAAFTTNKKNWSYTWQVSGGPLIQSRQIYCDSKHALENAKMNMDATLSRK